MCKIKETTNNVMKENIKDAIEVCNKMQNCKECVKAYLGVNNDKTFIPCNFIRKTYGVSIWDYKAKGRCYK
ncbi:TPA: hypothetical protein LA460_000109 [Clostridium botulinum]|nr:hypothetical protein [Clostridium botulinum]HBJ1652714.1 hypothetical protein [Clostridium botulinum]